MRSAAAHSVLAVACFHGGTWMRRVPLRSVSASSWAEEVGVVRLPIRLTCFVLFLVQLPCVLAGFLLEKFRPIRNSSLQRR